VGDLNRTEINVLLRVCERDSAGGISDDAKNDEQYSDDGGCLHEVVAFPARDVSATCDVMQIVSVTDVPGTRISAATCPQLRSGVICRYTGKEDDPAYEN